ncbi:hypothetical protein Daus18300_011802 [Diaporthe australafricana]|uniref:Metallo-beta-lactamase domain-containing protein n=1 Tax=Diaporthe australafricana TaxID=127596 RepID=A0ABR3W528_9PEZI
MSHSSKPSFDVPAGAVAKVSIIDSTLRLSKLKVKHLTKPPVEGFDEFPPLPTWSFLVESPGGHKALFDLGVHKDLGRYVPRIEQNIKEYGWQVDVEEHVADILQSHGVDPKEVNSVVWSHSHFDHIGDMRTFPPRTELVVGPGFSERWSPGFPTKPDAPVREEDLAGRGVREISFGDGELKVGPFPAHDFFGDGSFYLLDAPGHCLAHIAGLARTSTNPDTFIMMGGDLAHHGGELRPSPYTPIPDSLPQGGILPQSGTRFREMNVRRGRRADQPFIEPALFDDEHLSTQTIQRAQVADAQDNVWFVFAHDTSLFGSVDLFPQTANAWKEKGWKERVEWKFLGDLASGCAT